jgi:energy-converting hydrogenase Eha subunit F
VLLGAGRPPPGFQLAGLVLGAFEEPNWIGRVFGAFLGFVLLAALIMAIGFAPLDLYRREDIGPGKKLLWLAAFVASAGVVLVIYGAVRYSKTDGHAGW